MTVRLEDDVKERLDVLAEATQRSKSSLAAEAIRRFETSLKPRRRRRALGTERHTGFWKRSARVCQIRALGGRVTVVQPAANRLEGALHDETCSDCIVETNEWHIGETQAALKEADAGDFASDKDIAALAKKWKVNAHWMVADGTTQPRRRSLVHCLLTPAGTLAAGVKTEVGEDFRRRSSPTIGVLQPRPDLSAFN